MALGQGAGDMEAREARKSTLNPKIDPESMQFQQA